MLSRISKVDQLRITSVSNSSVTQIGDSNQIHGTSKALAVQREAEIFYGYEGDFALFPIFSEPIPLPPIVDQVIFNKLDLVPSIRVPHISIIGVSSSSIIHIGNSNNVYMESRVKHIRQIFSAKKGV
jgi:spore germination protein PE